MKHKYLHIVSGLMAAAVLLMTGCSKDALETKSTTKVSGDSFFETAQTALVPLNGIYGAMHKHGWGTTGDYAHSWAVKAIDLAAETMGDDMIIFSRGSGYFWRDHSYTMKERWTLTSSRSYSVWYQNYTYITNANYIIAAEKTMKGDEADVNYVIGQAYAIRAFGYFTLAQWFARTYVGHEDEPCVPVYTEPSVAGTKGKARSSVRAVYKQITDDLDKAVDLLKDADTHRLISHLDYYSVNGLRARVALVMEDWAKAESCAEIAMEKTQIGTGKELTDGMNSTTYKNVMWGAVITSDQTHYQRNLFAHMQQNTTAAPTAYGSRDPKYTTPWLYSKMGEKDVRRAWWNEVTVATSRIPSGKGYWQNKFRYATASTFSGDYIYMRHEEMMLIAAEAKCRQGDDTGAQKLLLDLMAKRDTDYTCTKTGKDLGALTTDLTGSLLEEILIQKRIELWGEIGRIYEIRRLKQGFVRNADQGFENRCVTASIGDTTNPESYMWVLPIPQTEFNGNDALDFAKDQNPLKNKE